MSWAALDATDILIARKLNLDGPGAFALREAGGRLMVWATIPDSENDDGRKAVYRSTKPITDLMWRRVQLHPWITQWERQ
jgi:hypothetical protein